MAEDAPFRSGFVTLLGRPNTGKSTLVNALVGRKVAIVTPHPQTTRTHLLGVVNRPPQGEAAGGQIVLVDTPGVHRGRGPLHRALLRSVRVGLEGRDLALLLADATRPFGSEDQFALDLLQSAPGAAMPPALLLLNKIDLLARRDQALPLLEAWRGRFPFAELVPISALRHQNLERLLELVLERLPPGPEYFPAGQASDQPEQFQIGELIREQAMLQTREEVPHTLAVQLESDSGAPGGGGRPRVILAVLVCERPGQKAILIGKGGERIREIGTASRKQLETALGSKVYLEMRVRVRADWREDPRFVASLDYRKGG
ncbi:MAG: GTPase Era [Terriglobales bacterium]